MQRLMSLFAGLALLTVGLIGSPVAAQVTVTSSEQTATATAWPPAQKAAARAMPLVGVTGEPVAAPAARGRRPRPGGRAGHPPGGRAATVADAPGTVPTFGTGSQVWYDYPPPFNLQVSVLDYIFTPTYPLTAVGKLFFQDGPTSYVCSASSITSAGDWGDGNKQTVITAGHCCSNGAGGVLQQLGVRAGALQRRNAVR